jgi:hypothetical protein
MHTVMFRRRIGPHPHADEGHTLSTPGCPDIWELDTGNFIVIGRDRTKDLLPNIPADATCGPDERMVEVDRHVLVRAKKDIPEV